MKKSYIQYLSTNRIGLHHSITIKNDEHQSNLLHPESHYACEVLYMISGSAEYIIGGKSYKVSPSDVVLVPPNTLHSMSVDLSEPYERMVLHIPPEILPTLQNFNILSAFNAAESFAYIIPKVFAQQSNIFPIFYEMCEICRNAQKSKYTDLHLINAILRLIEELTDTVEKIKATPDFEPNVAIKNENVHACVQYIQKNLTHPLTVEMVASAINLSSSHLSHAFKKALGISLKQYITKEKLSLAQKLLQQGYSATEVATSLGYDYYSTFYQQYIKRFRISPNELATRPTIALQDTYDGHTL